MLVSLIITTFNWKEALELSLVNALNQTRPPNEIIIADDGSSDGTKEVVTSFASVTDMPIIHSWQSDKGFRAAKSRNRAIVKAKGDYIVMIDGDIIPERHFIADHISFAQPGRFVQGARVLINKAKTEDILSTKQVKIRATDSNIGNRKNCLRSKLLSSLFSHSSEKLNSIKTCNFAFWRQDAIMINGFNEDFIGWGREDSEFAVRLMNSSIKRHNLRFAAVAYHLHHKRCPREGLAQNDALLSSAILEKKTLCNNGINQYL